MKWLHRVFSPADNALLRFMNRSGTRVDASVVTVDDAGVVSGATFGSTSLIGIASDHLIGRDTVGVGAAEEIAVGGGLEFTGTGGIQRSALTGDVQASAGSNTTSIPTTVISTAARTVLDDASVSAMVDTLGGAASTGTGGLVRATSPTLVTPALGTPASGTLTNCTGLPQAGTVGLTTADSPQFTAVNVGHATDTTLARSAAGILTVEGNLVYSAKTRPFQYNCGANGGLSADRFFSGPGNIPFTTTTGWLALADGVITDVALCVNITDAVDAGNTLDFQVRLNDSTQAALTISYSDATGTIGVKKATVTGQAVAVTAGDLITVRATLSGGTTKFSAAHHSIFGHYTR